LLPKKKKARSFLCQSATRTPQTESIRSAGCLRSGRAWVFALAVGTIVVWAITGPFFGFSDTWQLIINTGTTIVTFLMVFLIQNAQNRDGAAIQVKLNELIRASKAQNSFVGVEHLTEEELEEIRAKCESRAKVESGRHAGVRKVNGNHAGGGKKATAKSAAH
jgi:low affinity Fe/Cu permease